jgi:predicted transcriptional regulator
MQIQLDKKKIENQLTDLLISPCRLNVMNNLAEAKEEGLSFDEMKQQMTSHSEYLNKHVEKLIREAIIQNKDGKYYLTKDGSNLYKILEQVAAKIKTD